MTERHALRDQPADRRRTATHDEFDRIPMAQTGAGGEGVGHVRIERVFRRVEHGGDAALGVETGAFRERRLGHDRDLHPFGQPQGHAQAGKTATDNQRIEGFSVSHAAKRQGK